MAKIHILAWLETIITIGAHAVALKKTLLLSLHHGVPAFEHTAIRAAVHAERHDDPSVGRQCRCHDSYQMPGFVESLSLYALRLCRWKNALVNQPLAEVNSVIEVDF